MFEAPPCDTPPYHMNIQLRDELERVHLVKEQATGMGLASTGNMVELFAGKGGTSWTIVVTLPNGMSCPVLDGEGWEKLAIKIAGRVS